MHRYLRNMEEVFTKQPTNIKGALHREFEHKEMNSKIKDVDNFKLAEAKDWLLKLNFQTILR